MELEQIKKKSIAGVLSFFFRTVLLQGIGLASALVLSALFSPEEFGIYGFVVQIIGILIFISDIGLAAALVQKKEEPSLTEYRTVFTVQQLLAWVILIIVVGISFLPIISGKIGWAGVWVLISLGISFPLATFKTISSIKLERELEFSKVVSPQIVEQVVFHLVLIGLAWKGVGVSAYSYAILLRSLLGAVVMFWIQPWSIGFSLDMPSLKSLLKFGLKFQINDLLARIKDQLYFLALGLYFPLNQFGYIQWAKNWSLYPYNLTVQNVMSITFPTFSRLQDQKEALARAIEKSLFFISLVIFPLLVGMSIYIVPLVRLVERYHKWEPALFSLSLFTLSIGWGAISTPLMNTLNAIGHINTSLKLMVVWTVLTWVLTPICIWFVGFNGVALAAFLISFTSIWPMRIISKLLPVNIWEQVWRQLLAVACMGLIAFLGIAVWSQSFGWLLIGLIAGGVTYISVFMAVGFKRFLTEMRQLGIFRL